MRHGERGPNADTTVSTSPTFMNFRACSYGREVYRHWPCIRSCASCDDPLRFLLFGYTKSRGIGLSAGRVRRGHGYGWLVGFVGAILKSTLCGLMNSFVLQQVAPQYTIYAAAPVNCIPRGVVPGMQSTLFSEGTLDEMKEGARHPVRESAAVLSLLLPYNLSMLSKTIYVQNHNSYSLQTSVTFRQE